MGMMQQKTVQDFLEACAIDKRMTQGLISLEDGVIILEDMIKYVRDDIKTLDEAARKELDGKNKELIAINKQRKDQIRNSDASADPIDERNLKRKLLKEDHNRFKKELVNIQGICYRKGWLD